MSASPSPSHSPYDQYVQQLAALVRNAKTLPLGGIPDYPPVAHAPDAPVALIFSPHPDDEVIIGGWALRLLRQRGWRVINIAVTKGSSRARQEGRWSELTNCCRCIGFELESTGPHGLEGVTPKTRAEDATRWRGFVDVIKDVLIAHQPRVIFYPHGRDWNSTHVGTHHLIVDALAATPSSFHCATVETEYWQQMAVPNILVESSAEDLGAMISALTWHVEEVRRNPYHLTAPAWMMDNVRRGGEWVGGQGQAAPDFLFGTLYRVSRWANGKFEDVEVSQGFLDAGQDPAAMF